MAQKIRLIAHTVPFVNHKDLWGNAEQKPKHESHTNIYDIRQLSIMTDLPKLSVSKRCGPASRLLPAERRILPKSVVISLPTPCQTVMSSKHNRLNRCSSVPLLAKKSPWLITCGVFGLVCLFLLLFFFFNQPPKWSLMAGFRGRKIPSLNRYNSLSTTNVAGFQISFFFFPPTKLPPCI